MRTYIYIYVILYIYIYVKHYIYIYIYMCPGEQAGAGVQECSLHTLGLFCLGPAD